jgi:hypothetical protein
MDVRSACLAALLVPVCASALAQEPAAEPRRRTNDNVLWGFVPGDDEGFITKAELDSLGCAVDKVSGLYADVPLHGYRAFRFKNKKDCAIDLTTTITEIRYAKKDATGLWAEVDEDAARRARKCKSAAEVRESASGEKSRLTLFPGTSDKCGFSYVVQDRGYLYELSSYGSTQMTPALTKIVEAKLDALVSGQAVGIYDKAR